MGVEVRKLLVTVAIIAIAFFGYTRFIAPRINGSATEIGAEKNNSQVNGTGVVTRILPDDDQGSRHQRFILQLPSGQTVLIAHNIDIAPKVTDLQVGDNVEFSGEFVWNSKGGVVHWTHHDPSGSHVAGWLKRNGQVFQ